MKRRDFILLVGAAMIAARPIRAQQKAMPVIGYLNGTSPGRTEPFVAAFRHGLNETGYIEGQNVAIEYRWAEGFSDRLPALAADLVDRRVNVIATSGGDSSALAAKAATPTIPIVTLVGGDPVRAGLVASLARPGGNLTGFSLLVFDLTPKLIELLLELVPQTKVVAALVNPNGSNYERVVLDLQEAAGANAVQLHVLKARSETEIGDALATLVQLKAGALIVPADAFFYSRRGELVELVARHAVPAIYSAREFAVVGGLISYGTNVPAVHRQAGIYVGRILNGAKPADLPVQQPTRFDFVVNLKTANALGLTIPPAILVRADEVVE